LEKATGEAFQITTGGSRGEAFYGANRKSETEKQISGNWEKGRRGFENLSGGRKEGGKNVLHWKYTRGNVNRASSAYERDGLLRDISNSHRRGWGPAKL